MENNLNNGRAFEWDDVVQHDSEDFELLPEGDCDFEVKNFERGRHNGSEKLPPCNKAILKIKVTNAEGKSTTVTHNLLLHSKCEGMICAFFTAIGQRKHGEQLRMNWNTVVGSRGRCKIGIRNYTANNGEVRQSNEIKRFYDPAENAPRQAAPAPQQTSFAAGMGSATGGFGGGFSSGGFSGGFGGNR